MKSLFCVIVAVLASSALAFDVPKVEGVDVLTTSNLNEARTGNWLLILYAPWCPHCHHLLEKLPDLSRELKEQNVKIGIVDADAEPAIQIQFSMHGFPSIYLVRDSFVYSFSQKVSPSVDNLVSWATKTYADMEPVTGYKAPFGLPMRVFAVYSSFAISIYRFLEVYANQLNIPTMWLFCGLAVFIAVFVIVLMCITSHCFQASQKCSVQKQQKEPEPAVAPPAKKDKEVDARRTDEEPKKKNKEEKLRRRAVNKDEAGAREQQRMAQNKIKNHKSSRQQNMPTQQPSKH